MMSASAPPNRLIMSACGHGPSASSCITRVLRGMTGVAGVDVDETAPPTGELCVRLMLVAATADTDRGGATPFILSAFAFFSLSRASVCARTFSAALADIDAEIGMVRRAFASATGRRDVPSASRTWISVGVPVVCACRGMRSELGSIKL